MRHAREVSKVDSHLFLANAQASQPSRKLFTHVTHTLWVSKTFPQIRGTQRTLNQDRTTRDAYYFWESVNTYGLDAGS